MNGFLLSISAGHLGRRIVLAGLQQQHAAVRILAQPAREDRAGGPGTDHDVVELGLTLAPSSSITMRRARVLRFARGRLPASWARLQARNHRRAASGGPAPAPCSGIASGQRALKLHPAGRSIGLGGSPSSRHSAVVNGRSSSVGIALSRARV